MKRTLVPRAGLEPARAIAHQILSLARLPIPPPRHKRTLQTTPKLYHIAAAETRRVIIRLAMNPTDDQSNGRVGTPLSDQRRPITPPPRDFSSSQHAAAEVIRGQLDAIYSGRSQQRTPHTTPVAQQPQPTASVSSEPQPVASTQSSTKTAQPASAPKQHAMQTQPPTEHPTGQRQPQTAVHTQIVADQWKQYHSSWQKYYQMYYERYYANHLTTRDQEISKLNAQIAEKSAKTSANTPAEDPNNFQTNAMKELRSQIQQKVRDSATKVKKSRHFVPAVAGVAVFLLFMFLQYNRIIFGAVAAYTTPGNIDPQNIIVDAATDVSVSPDPKLIIPKINVDVPVVYGVDATDHQAQMRAMEKGVFHFSIAGANAVPGQVGNAVFAAHSSNDAFASGDYKFIFAQNEKLVKGDVIYMNYEGKRYTYSVTSLEVVMPNEVSKVQLQTDKPMLTLISCVPLGTAEKRLLVFAEQINPDPAKATASSTNTSVTNASTDIPGKPSPTLIERLFGAR